MIELKPAINEVKLTLKSISSPINLGTVLEPSGGGGSCVPTEVRQAIYTLLDNAAYATTGLEDEIAIVQAWAQEVTALTLEPTSLELNNDTPQVITATTIPSGSTVTWSSSNESVATVVDGVVTGVGNGSCVITATAGTISLYCTVTVSGFPELSFISAEYTQSGTVYNVDPLDSLKADLVVTATYTDFSTETVPSDEYTLSGTLTAGTSTITVTYRTKTTTFDVTVTQSLYPMTITDSLTDGVGWGSVGYNSASSNPPYTSNSNKNRIHILYNALSTGIPIKPGKKYKITLGHTEGTEGVVPYLFNTSAAEQLDARQNVTVADYKDDGFRNMTAGVYTYTPQATINGKSVARMWLVFRRNSTNSNWGSRTIFPVTIEEEDA